MQNNLQAKIDNYKTKRERKKKSRRMLLTLSLVAALCTMYLLILPAITQNGQAYCGFEEHTHGAECHVTEIVTEDVLICPLDESEEHTHGLECYETSELEVTTSELKCELEEHTHILECFSNPEADLESPEIWKATFDSVELSGNWAEDLVAVAKTQIGYEESKKNYIVLEDGETMLGYTRYGQWYGMPYGEWSGMFTAFCLNYAGVEGVDYDQDLSSWVEKAKTAQLYIDKAQHTPKAGDLVYFDVDKNGEVDAIGIISEYMAADGTEPAAIKVIEGDVEDKVNVNTYELSNDIVKGFVKLPENPNPGSINEGGDGEASNKGAATYDVNNVENGDKYHAQDYLRYQRSSHKLDGSSVVTFMLIPSEDYSDSWTPSGAPWMANGNHNYVVAYCCDKNTYTSSSGANYKTYTLDKSRFTDDTTRRTLDGIIKHSYPFITSQQMKDQLAAAYTAREITVNITNCKESEFIAATQWALWDTSNVTGTIAKSTAGSKPSEKDQYYPLKDSHIGYGNGSSQSNDRIKAIRDWLVKQITPVELEVQDYQTDVERNQDGLYNLDVQVTLNRPVTDDETVYVKIVAGDKQSQTIALQANQGAFDINIDDLTAQQILDAEVDIQIDAQGIQTYYYDSEDYQDLIGGAWGATEAQLSFKLADEVIDASVKKVWSPQITGDKPVQVQLYADGIAYGDKVTLNRKNNWEYTWTDLPKLNALYEDTVYTIKEDPVPGYVSKVTNQNGSSDKVQVWQQVDQLEAGGTYLLRSKSGFLEQHTFKNNEKLTWSVIDLSDVASTPKESMWTASKNGSGFNLKNNKNTSYYLGYNDQKIYPSTSEADIRYDGDHIYRQGSSTKYYFTYINTDGDGLTTTDANSAASFDIFKLTEVDMPNSDVSFVLTNTEITEVTSVDVTKKWEGKRDKTYPLTVEITLLQNGEPYGNPVELNEDNNWTYKWVDVPAKAGDTTYEYTILETPVAGYEQSITSTKDDAGQHFVVTNTWIPEYATMFLSKVDFDDPNALLAGAVFELYGAALDNEPVAVVSGTDGELGTFQQEITVGQNGTIVIDNLLVGESYYLVETKAPEGYSLLKEPIKFVIQKEDGKNVVKIEQAQQWASVLDGGDGLAISVKNERGYSLPETGGPGTEMFKIAGTLLMIVTALIYLKRRSVKL